MTGAGFVNLLKLLPVAQELAAMTVVSRAVPKSEERASNSVSSSPHVHPCVDYVRLVALERRRLHLSDY